MDGIKYMTSLFFRELRYQIRRFVRRYGWWFRRWLRELLIDTLLIGGCAAGFMLIWSHFF